MTVKSDPGFRQELLDVSSVDAPLSPAARSLFIGGGGDISFTAEGDSAPVTWTVPAGFYVFMRVKVVHNSGTTATNIVAIR
jgi:hypothetical protein